METVIIEAKKRDQKVSAKNLRKEKLIPGVYYGKGVENVDVLMDYQTFRKAFIKGGYSQIMDLDVEGKKFKVLIQEVKTHPLTGAIEHVDFINVNLKEEITTEVPVELEGIAPAVKDFGGVLTTVKHELEVKCLPGDLPHAIAIDITVLVDFSRAIHIRDIKVPKGVVLMGNPDDVVITVSAPRVEEAAVPAAETPEAAPAGGAAAPAAEAKEEKKD